MEELKKDHANPVDVTQPEALLIELAAKVWLELNVSKRTVTISSQQPLVYASNNDILQRLEWTKDYHSILWSDVNNKSPRETIEKYVVDVNIRLTYNIE